MTEAERRGVTIADRALYIYTSGTTGLPKAANVSHHRLMQWSHWFAGLMNTAPAIACTTACRCITASAAWSPPARCWCGGGSVVMRERFSASTFWDDVVDGTARCFSTSASCAAICVNAPAAARDETQHRLRLCCGNGLRAEVWETFQERFRIPQILEFYAATEGNFSLYNCRRQSRRHRPHSAVSRASLPAGAGEV